jgi:hypothetical protein
VPPRGDLVPVVGGDPGGGGVAENAEDGLLDPGGLDQLDGLAGLLLRGGPVLLLGGEQRELGQGDNGGQRLPVAAQPDGAALARRTAADALARLRSDVAVALGLT